MCVYGCSALSPGSRKDSTQTCCRVSPFHCFPAPLMFRETFGYLAERKKRPALHKMWLVCWSQYQDRNADVLASVRWRPLESIHRRSSLWVVRTDAWWQGRSRTGPGASVWRHDPCWTRLCSGQGSRRSCRDTQPPLESQDIEVNPHRHKMILQEQFTLKYKCSQYLLFVGGEVKYRSPQNIGRRR